MQFRERRRFPACLTFCPLSSATGHCTVRSLRASPFPPVLETNPPATITKVASPTSLPAAVRGRIRAPHSLFCEHNKIIRGAVGILAPDDPEVLPMLLEESSELAHLLLHLWVLLIQQCPKFVELHHPTVVHHFAQHKIQSHLSRPCSLSLSPQRLARHHRLLVENTAAAAACTANLILLVILSPSSGALVFFLPC